MISYRAVVLLSWALFLLVWSIGALDVKRDVRVLGRFCTLTRRFALLRFGGALFVAILVIWFVSRTEMGGTRNGSAFISSYRAFPPTLVLGWSAAALTVFGIAFAIWARMHLGRNWSSRPAVKAHHELVTSGPYAFVRHPIYTGLLLAGLGSMLTGTLFGIGVCVLLSTIFLSRLDKEEILMLELFPKEYRTYQARTKRLIPFVW